MHDLAAMRAFVALGETGSFAAAADKLGMSRSVVSHHVAKLEAQLDTTLCNRTTRRVGLTEAGERYLERAQPIVRETESLFADTRAVSQTMSGTLKLAIAPGVAEHVIVPVLLDLLSEHASLKIILDVDAEQSDVVANGYDAAIRCGPPSGAGLKGRKLTKVQFTLCASEKYLTKNGTPASVADLGNHDVATWYSGGGASVWSFQTDQGLEQSIPRGRIQANSLDVLLQSARRGFTIAALPNQLAEPIIETGDLIEVLPETRIGSMEVWCLWPEKALMPARLRAMIDHLANRLTPKRA